MPEDVQLQKGEVWACDKCGDNAVVLRPEAPRSAIHIPLCKKHLTADDKKK